MRKNMTAQEIIAKHLESDRIIASLSLGEYKKNNREVDKTIKLFKIVEHDLDLAKEVYGVLLTSDLAVTKLQAAAACLSLEIYIDDAIRNLIELSDRTDIGMISFHAEMSLEAWKKNGCFAMYPEQGKGMNWV
jgi:hypothetical protein